MFKKNTAYIADSFNHCFKINTEKYFLQMFHHDDCYSYSLLYYIVLLFILYYCLYYIVLLFFIIYILWFILFYLYCSFFFYMQFSFRTWAIMALDNFLFLRVLSNVWLFNIPLCPRNFVTIFILIIFAKRHETLSKALSTISIFD